MTNHIQSDGVQTLSTDTGPFSLVYEWLLDTDVSDRAIRLYALLGRYADRNGHSFPGRKKLAERLRCSENSVDRAVKELVDVGALIVQPRYRDGARVSNTYMLVAARLSVVTPLPTDGDTPLPTGGEQNENHFEREKETPPVRPPHSAEVEVREVKLVRRKVDGKVVTGEEAALAAFVLLDWNAQTGQNLTSHDWTAKIIMRIREHPEFGVEDHAHVIAAALRDPWWSGPPSPSVVYGNGAQFERCIEAARAGPGPPSKRDMRYGRGMTTRQILDATKDLP